MNMDSNCKEKNRTNLTKLTIDKPITHNTWQCGRFTTYQIEVQSRDISFTLSHSIVRRRYSEFLWLWKKLKNNHRNCVKVLPSLPPKKYFLTRFNSEFINKRKELLEKWLNELILVPLYLSDVCLHLFLQTTLSIKEMENYLNRNSLESLEQLWENLETDCLVRKHKPNSEKQSNAVKEAETFPSNWLSASTTYVPELGLCSPSFDAQHEWKNKITSSWSPLNSKSLQSYNNPPSSESLKTQSEQNISGALNSPCFLKKKVQFSNEVTVAEVQIPFD